MSGYFERIKSQDSPAAALTEAAVIIKELDERVQYCEERIILIEKDRPSGWDQWDEEALDEEAHKRRTTEKWSPPEGVAEKIEELKDQLSGCEDAKESQALRAQIFLLEDQLRPPPDMGDDLEQRRAKVSFGDDSSAVELPVVDLKEEDMREDFARKVLKIPEYYGDRGEEYVQSYRKGGPLLFYYSDRDFIMSQPDDIKRTLVLDVEQSSPNEAHEMARDILKDTEPNGPDMAVENQIRMQAQGG